MPVPSSPDQVDSNINNIIKKNKMSQTYLQTVPVTLTNSRRDIEVHTNALLDTGSDTTLMNISNAVTNTRKISSQLVNFIITPQTNKCDCFNIDDARVINKLIIK